MSEEFKIQLTYREDFDDKEVLIAVTRNGRQWSTENIPLDNWETYADAIAKFNYYLSDVKLKVEKGKE